MNHPLFQRNFTIMLIGQIISLFGNSILRFSLSLFVLDQTGSAAIFGAILALSMIPTVLFSPIGGALADRLPRQKIMVYLDFFTATLILLFDFFFAHSGNLAAITLLMIVLALIQAFYQPSVQASIPLLVAEEHLLAANGTVLQVQALANLLGPILGGCLYGYLGLFPILIASGACFFVSAVMELFLHIPFVPQSKNASITQQIKADLVAATHFLIKENRRLFQMLLIIAGINLFLSALFIVGLPFLVKIYLGLSSQLYGFAEAALGVGSIIGGFAAAFFTSKVSFPKAYLFLFASTILLLPIVVAIILQLPSLIAYGIILVCVVFSMASAALFNISCLTFMQKQTPNHLLGKVASFVTTVCTCALPIGQAMYGYLFDLGKTIPWLVILFGCMITLLLVIATKNALKNIPS